MHQLIQRLDIAESDGEFSSRTMNEQARYVTRVIGCLTFLTCTIAQFQRDDSQRGAQSH